MKTNHYSFIFLLFASSFCLTKSHAQLSLTPYATFNKLGGANMLGVGFRGEIEGLGKNVDGKFPLFGGVAFGFGSAKSTQYVSAYSSLVTPSQLEIPVTYKFTLIHIFLGGKIYFGQGEYSEGGFYGLGDVGLMIVPIKTKYDPYNEALYYPTGGSATTGGESKETLSDIMFDFGLGLEKGSDDLKFFGEAKIAIPMSGVSSREGTDSPLGIGIAVNVGIRLSMGR